MKNIKLAYNQNDQNQTKLLYKYVTEDRYSILLDGLIRFTQPQAFNDPFELKPFIKSLSSKSQIEKDIDKTIEEVIRNNFKDHAESLEKEELIQQLIKVAQQEKNKDILLKDIQLEIQKQTPNLQEMIRHTFENHIGILSLTENDQNLLMWSHYANSHQGFVIEFNSEHSFFNQRKSSKDDIRHIRPVLYNKHRPRIELSSIKNLDLFTVKSDDWAYEEEWRMLLALKDADKTISSTPYDIHLFKVPFSAITSIVFGARTSDETKSKIKNIIRNNPDLSHIKTYGMKTHDSKFRLIKNHKSI